MGGFFCRRIFVPRYMALTALLSPACAQPAPTEPDFDASEAEVLAQLQSTQPDTARGARLDKNTCVDAFGACPEFKQYCGYAGVASYCCVTCSGGTPPSEGEERYTPEQADWKTFASKPFENGANTSHDPDGVGWISAEDWAAAEWDGTVYNPSQMSPQNFAAAICPSVDRVRGLRQAFYRHNPFADNENPTKAEVDEWHRIAINHVRALVGYTSDDRLVQKDHCMFARALWGDERKFTTMWDAEYPGALGSAYGPCQGSHNGHCGANFIPDPEDQAPYLPDGHSGCSTQAGAEGVFSGPKSNIPWSIKWSRGFCNTLLAEGFWGGHVGPWFHREKFGFSFWDDDPDDNNNNAVLRAKWTGKLLPSLYCNPSAPDCDPANTGPGTQD